MVRTSSTPAQAEQFSPCQEAIQRHLQVDLARASDALLLLCQSEVKREADATGALLDCGTICCFDLENKPPRWSAVVLCARCDAVNHMLQVTVEGSNIREGALRSTQCASQTERQGVVHALPIELIEMILDAFIASLNPKFDEDGSGNFDRSFQIAEASEAEINAAFCSLLHTSRAVRAWLVRYFPPRMPTRDGKAEKISNNPTGYNSDDMGELHPQMEAFVHEAVRWYLSNAHHRIERPALPECQHNVFVSGEEVRKMRFEAVVPDKDGNEHSAKWVRLTKVGNAHEVREASALSLNVRDACEILLDSLSHVLPPPIETNPFYRCLRWRTRGFDPKAKIAVQLTMLNLSPGDRVFFKTWIYSAREPGESNPHRYFWL